MHPVGKRNASRCLQLRLANESLFEYLSMAAHSCVYMCVCLWAQFAQLSFFVHDENKILKTKASRKLAKRIEAKRTTILYVFFFSLSIVTFVLRDFSRLYVCLCSMLWVSVKYLKYFYLF